MTVKFSRDFAIKTKTKQNENRKVDEDNTDKSVLFTLWLLGDEEERR